MEKKEPGRKNQQLIRRLYSADDEEVLSVIREIRHGGNPGLIPAVMKLYSQTASPAITREIVALIRDMKSQPAVERLFPALQEISDPQRKQQMVAACWQSGLDFSAHIPVFLQIFLDGDYMTALEAFTVIENSLFYVKDAGTLKEHILFLKKQSRKIPPDSAKTPLLNEMIKVLEENLLMS